jgi:hypothetical protein
VFASCRYNSRASDVLCSGMNNQPGELVTLHYTHPAPITTNLAIYVGGVFSCVNEFSL